MRIPAPQFEKDSPVKWNSKLGLWLSKVWQVINAQIEFGKMDNSSLSWWQFTQKNPYVGLNINGVFIPIVSIVPNQAVTVTHNLGRVPQGCILIGCANNNLTGGNIMYYTTGDYQSWTSTQMTLRFQFNYWVLLFVF